MALDLSPLSIWVVEQVRTLSESYSNVTISDLPIPSSLQEANSHMISAALRVHDRVSPYVVRYHDQILPHAHAVFGEDVVRKASGMGTEAFATAALGLKDFRLWINESMVGLEAWQVMILTVLLWTFAQSYVWPIIAWARGFSREKFWQIIFRLPIMRWYVAKEIQKIRVGMQESLVHPGKDLDRFESLPRTGLTAKDVVKQVDDHNEIETIDWREGRISGTVYDGGEELSELLTTVWGKTVWSNPLHPDVFLGVRKMDAEIVSMVRDMFHGDREEGCGTTTSGGTESILMACRAHIVKYRYRTSAPEIIVSDSVHAAFDKACEYFGAKLVKLPVNKKTRKADVRAYYKAINKNTVLIVGSAPSFAHGVMDPISELAQLAEKYDVGMHVDACLGGFLIAFMKEAGFTLPAFDFRIKGVTSMSVDTHKYGFAPKGNSVVLYSNKALRHCQYFTQPNWTGGVYASPSIAGSRSGAIIAASWAALIYHGRSGYVETTRQIITAARTVRQGVEKIKGIDVCGDPLVSVVAFKSDVFDIYLLQSYLNERKWNMSALQFPPSIHIACTGVHKPNVIKDFIADIAAGVKEIMKNPGQPNSGAAAVYGTAAAIPDRSMITKIAAGFCDTLFDLQNSNPNKKTE